MNKIRITIECYEPPLEKEEGYRDYWKQYYQQIIPMEWVSQENPHLICKVIAVINNLPIEVNKPFGKGNI
jgi:hypothetical protein